MSAPAGIEDHPLRRNRDFNLLWVGQVLSDVGGNASAIAFPLLALATTGSPVRAGIVGAAARLPDLVLSVPGGTRAILGENVLREHGVDDFDRGLAQMDGRYHQIILAILDVWLELLPELRTEDGMELLVKHAAVLD